MTAPIEPIRVVVVQNAKTREILAILVTADANETPGVTYLRWAGPATTGRVPSARLAAHQLGHTWHAAYLMPDGITSETKEPKCRAKKRLK